MYFTELKNKEVVGFYNTEIHGEEKCNLVLENGGIKIDEELHQHLLSLGQSKFIGVKEDKVYTLSDKDLFEKIIATVDDTPQAPTTEERLGALELALLEML